MEGGGWIKVRGTGKRKPKAHLNINICALLHLYLHIKSRLNTTQYICKAVLDVCTVYGTGERWNRWSISLDVQRAVEKRQFYHTGTKQNSQHTFAAHCYQSVSWTQHTNIENLVRLLWLAFVTVHVNDPVYVQQSIFHEIITSWSPSKQEINLKLCLPCLVFVQQYETGQIQASTKIAFFIEVVTYFMLYVVKYFITLVTCENFIHIAVLVFL